ncbi:hypothetical protein [Dyadobacter sandarakinus]|uniref:Uncharacterized protein n=1 Tax=Dyadobacter sandarakinus TaxID=2747268 RepID=A0ABX7I218_9BACT|nr:hypothetical protein [Dyadobacter sandarakinus]QRR00122.1 hypothetical protein HWI92_03955 [Dyadobacter sandarakinus]
MQTSSEAVLGHVLKAIEEAKAQEKAYLLFTYSSQNVSSPAIQTCITQLRALNIYVSFFWNSEHVADQRFPSLYLCWTEEARDQAIARGYNFD